MLKLSDKSICKPHNIIFKSCLMQGIFKSQWKKGNVVPIHKKNDKQCVKNCRPLSLFTQSVVNFSNTLFTTQYSHIL